MPQFEIVLKYYAVNNILNVKPTKRLRKDLSIRWALDFIFRLVGDLY